MRKKQSSRIGRTIVLDGKRVRVDADASTVGSLLRALEISPQEALVKVDGKIRPEGAPIGKRDKIEVIRVVFGG